MYKRLIIASLFLLAISCDNTTEGSKGKQPDAIEFQTLHTSIPDTTSNPYALAVKNIVESLGFYFQPINSLIGAMDGYDWTYNNNTYRYTFQFEGGSFTYEIIENENGSYTFNYIVNGSYGSTTVTDFVLFSGTYSADGGQGNWSMYDLDQNDDPYVYFTYTWSIDGNSTGFTITEYSGPGVIYGTYSIVVNTDGSGTLNYVENSVTRQSATWAADGHGTVNYYDEQGDLTDTQNW
ncbi:MAG: hypothetical protein KDD94_03390 [Calditrichaeota bacterium]|nr:hypothetical protein [Calditrichota bacterium]